MAHVQATRQIGVELVAVSLAVSKATVLITVELIARVLKRFRIRLVDLLQHLLAHVAVVLRFSNTSPRAAKRTDLDHLIAQRCLDGLVCT